MMTRVQSLKIASLSLIGLAAVAASPAAAGRCGHLYPVDAPTTLSKVARACNVSLAALREANLGVDPGNVRPGEHLSVPGERARFVSTPAVTDEETDNHSKALSGPVTYLTTQRGPDARAAQRVRIRERSVSGAAPLWLQPEAVSGGHYSANAHISFQKYAALRIRTASLSAASVQISPADGAPLSLFTGEPAITRGYRLPDYNKIGAPASQTLFSISGEVADISQGCLVLMGADNQIWRLVATLDAETLIGKRITAWGTSTRSGACGVGPSMLISHAIYAEPWVGE